MAEDAAIARETRRSPNGVFAAGDRARQPISYPKERSLEQTSGRVMPRPSTRVFDPQQLIGVPATGEPPFRDPDQRAGERWGVAQNRPDVAGCPFAND
jgi:hypothetical protein